MSNKTLNTETETLLVGEAIARNLRPGIFVSLKGDLGAGKTCLARGILRGLGHTGRVKSPTYPLVEIYHFENLTVYHFDFYRIEDEEEAYDFGYEEYLFSGQICLVEWPEKISNLLPQKFGLIEIAEHEGKRSIHFTPTTTILP